jgi:hypothetical protein
MRKPPPNVLELPLIERAEMALRAAAEKVWEEHAREGLPIIIWRDGKIVEVPPEEVRARCLQSLAGNDKKIPQSE